MVTSKTHRIRSFVPSVSADDRTRYFLKVQDGCRLFLFICTIPFAGRSRNGSIADLVKQAQQVVEEGGKEIVLTGVNIGDFGHTTKESFIDLLRELDQVDGVERYRISSIEPNLLSDEIIDFVASSRRFAPHFHMPLQAGSDTVLQLMKRRYDTTLFRHKVEKIKRFFRMPLLGRCYCGRARRNRHLLWWDMPLSSRSTSRNSRSPIQKGQVPSTSNWLRCGSTDKAKTQQSPSTCRIRN